MNFTLNRDTLLFDVIVIIHGMYSQSYEAWWFYIAYNW